VPRQPRPPRRRGDAALRLPSSASSTLRAAGDASPAAAAVIAAAPILILANAGDARRFAATSHLPLRAARGQVSHLPATAGSAPEVVVCRLGYVTPAIDGLRCAGATFAVDDDEAALRAADHAENLAAARFHPAGYSRHIRRRQDSAVASASARCRPTACR
jgi:tRNA 5-methylaminomethyl-2-thiouridine biosynthesis bifunctional protein